MHLEILSAARPQPGRLARRWAIVTCALLVTLSACAAPGPAATSTSSAPAAPARSGPKAITIAFPVDPTALGGSMSGLGAAAVPSRYFKEFDNAYLTTYNQN